MGPATADKTLPQPVKPAMARPRHYGVLASFLLCVAIPVLASALYLFTIAKDQYVSTIGFAVRSESISSALDLLGGLSSLSGTSSSDTDILYQYIQSQELVQKIDEKLNLHALFSKPDFDPIFAFDPTGSVEDLTRYWQRMVRIFYDNGTGLIELRVHAFDPEDARRIAQAIFDDSSTMINMLSATARDDATGYARDELDRAVERLSEARIALTQFRSRTQIIDPVADIQGQMGLLSTLQQQLVSAMIERSLMRETARADDPRISQAERRIAVIEEMIDEERRKLGVGASGGQNGSDMSTLIGEFERLSVDREFAEKAYLAALTAFETAQAEAQRKSRYLAAYSGPTLSQEPQYPRRATLTGLVLAFSLMIWSIGLLIYYSVRDRR
ncbi:MAG: sugar transporter [Rhodobacteraceae bacterium]|nr:sugar transporter [Paracoccaceae bacterium]